MKKIFFVSMFIIAAYGINAQDYNAAVGIRGGVSQGITLKTFVGGSSAFDLILGTAYHGFNFTALYEIHSHDVFGVDNLALFYGIGGHVGFYNSTFYPTSWGTYTSGPVIGIDGVIGIEYTFDEIPINIGLDIVPTLNVFPGLWYWQRGALSIRYVFK